ncbi:MAG: formylmethanofuran dehydrogenase subunit C [Planctomycetota bacterium]|nr:MAG: formylmethanofuran dehydrogenase subunit C [Planctomycetota bacterium]
MGAARGRPRTWRWEPATDSWNDAMWAAFRGSVADRLLKRTMGGTARRFATRNLHQPIPTEAMLELILKREPQVPLEAEVICPDVLCGLSMNEIAQQRVFHGKRACRLADFFEIEGAPSDSVMVRGDLRKVRWIGRGMTRGSIEVQGDVGMHLGAYMRGGRIAVQGNAGDWVGAEMQGGVIVVSGDAGGQVGAAYRGSLRGMNRGTILIGGNTGLEIGMRMRRGTIVVGGMARDFAGLQMKGGTILLLGGAELRVGAWMQRGTIISLKPIVMMPTFRPSGRSNPVFMNLLARELRPLGVDFPLLSTEGSYARFAGDAAVPGKGEIFVWEPH